MAEPCSRGLVTFGTVKNWLRKPEPNMTVMSAGRTPASIAIIHLVIVHCAELE